MKKQKKHKFLADRQVDAMFIVCRIDDYSLNTSCSVHGGFPPTAPNSYGQKGGYLWPTFKQANEAARYMLKKFPNHTYGVFQLRAISEKKPVEPVLPEVRVTLVG